MRRGKWADKVTVNMAEGVHRHRHHNHQGVMVLNDDVSLHPIPIKSVADQPLRGTDPGVRESM